MPSSSVYGVARFQNGFLWIGTNKGLARFDGAQFSVFNHANMPGLKQDSVSDMAVGPDGEIYVATPTGMTVVKDGRGRTFDTAADHEEDAVHVVLAVGPDEAWFGTARGHLYHYRAGAIQEAGLASLSRNGIYGLAAAANGTLWIGTENGLFLLKAGEINRYQPRRPLPVKGFFDLAITQAGEVFAATDDGVLEIKADDWRFWTTKQGLPSDRVQVLATASGNTVWIGTSAGVAHLAEGRVERVKDLSCSVTALHFDAEQSLWAGCENAGGLFQVRQPIIRIIPALGHLLTPDVNSIAEERGGVVWMATAHGLVRREHNRSQLYTRKDGLPADNVYSVALSRNGALLIGTENGFATMRNRHIRAFHTRSPGPDPIFSLLEDRVGRLWVGSAHGLLRQDSGRARLETVPEIEGSIRSVREDREENIWVSTDRNGLYELSGASVGHFTAASGLASDTVADTLETENGDIWAATNGGLSRIRGGQCASLRAENGLSAEHIIGFGLDPTGNLWLRVLDGIATFDMAQAEGVLDKGGMLDRPRFFGRADVFGEQFTTVSGQNSVIRCSSGVMWFATLSGIGVIDPASLNKPMPALRPEVTSLVSDAGAHDLAHPVTIKPGDLRVQFAYTAPSLTGTRDPEFRYQLVGFDESWRSGSKQREAEYTILPPGKYSFRVSARRPFEPWSDPSNPFEVVVLPHFYQTWWWYALLAALFTSMLVLAYHFRLMTVRRQFSTLMSERLRERSRLARELHDTLSQGMVGIHLQIEAAQVLLDVDPASVRQHLESVGRLARDASIETRKSIAELRSGENEDPTLIGTIRRAAVDFNRSCTIALTTQISEDLPQFDSEVIHEISRILGEALANVRLHSGAKHAVVSAGVGGQFLMLEVRDDGQGFPADPANRAPGHFGITGMGERAQRINGRLQLTSSPADGTSVTLSVPLRARWYDSGVYIRPWIQSIFRRCVRSWHKPTAG